MLWSAHNIAAPTEWQLLKSDAGSQVYRAGSENTGDVIVKQFVLRNKIKQWRFAKRCKVLQRFYRALTLPTPRLLGAGLDRQRGLGECVYTIVPGIDLRQVADLDTKSWNQLFTQVGELVNRLHQVGWVHGDLKFGNILYDHATSSIYLIDLDSVAHPIFGFSKKRARDIARFILNALEKDWPKESIEVFWIEASKGLSAQVLSSLKKNTKRWLEEFSHRHMKSYGSDRRRPDLSVLTFLE